MKYDSTEMMSAREGDRCGVWGVLDRSDKIRLYLIVSAFLLIGGIDYCSTKNEPLKQDNTLSTELRPYDLNRDEKLDVSELENLQRDYELRRR